MLPDVSAQPGSGQIPICCANGSVLRGRVCPDVGVVMAGPATASVHLLGGLRAPFGETLEEIEEHLVAFGKIGHFGRPVVHLEVDVRRVLGSPDGLRIAVPDALEICGKSGKG